MITWITSAMVQPGSMEIGCTGRWEELWIHREGGAEGHFSVENVFGGW